MIKYSIIIPAYNAEQTIVRCLDSILNQEYQNFEIIAINDGSKDKTLDILKSYASIHTQLKVINKENGGVSSARNAGINVAQGEYLVFIDADDYIESDYLSSFKDYSEDIIIGGFQNFGDNNDLQVPTNTKYVDKQAFAHYIAKNFIYLYLRTPWCKVFRRDIIIKNNLRFDKNIKLGEDTLFVFQYILKSRSFRTISTCAYRYFYIDVKISTYHLSSLDYKYCILNFEKICNELFGKQLQEPIKFMRLLYANVFISSLHKAKPSIALYNSTRYFLNRLYRSYPDRITISNLKYVLKYMFKIFLSPIISITKRSSN